MVNDSVVRVSEYKASSNHLYSEIGSEAVILDLGSGVYYGLNEVGVDIWNWLQEAQTKEEILSLLLTEYEVTSEQAEEDIEALFAQFLEIGLIEVAK